MKILRVGSFGWIKLFNMLDASRLGNLNPKTLSVGSHLHEHKLKRARAWAVAHQRSLSWAGKMLTNFFSPFCRSICTFSIALVRKIIDWWGERTRGKGKSVSGPKQKENQRRGDSCGLIAPTYEFRGEKTRFIIWLMSLTSFSIALRASSSLPRQRMCWSRVCMSYERIFTFSVTKTLLVVNSKCLFPFDGVWKKVSLEWMRNRAEGNSFRTLQTFHRLEFAAVHCKERGDKDEVSDGSIWNFWF